MVSIVVSVLVLLIFQHTDAMQDRYLYTPRLPNPHLASMQEGQGKRTKFPGMHQNSDGVASRMSWAGMKFCTVCISSLHIAFN